MSLVIAFCLLALSVLISIWLFGLGVKVMIVGAVVLTLVLSSKILVGLFKLGWRVLRWVFR